MSRSEAFRLWLRVALQSFGGPAGQIAVIHRLVVDEKRWLDEQRFLHALSYCMLLPGPEAQQLATYIGWLFHGVRGGLVAGLLFIAPGFISILALSILYASYGDVGIVAGVFYGLKPAVIAVVLQAVVGLRRRALTTAHDVVIAAAAFAAIWWLGVPFPLVVLGAALVGLMVGPRERAGTAEPVSRPSLVSAVRTAGVWLAIWLGPLACLWAMLGAGHVFVREGVFFSKAALVTFGGAYSVLTYVAQQAVEAYGWLDPLQMLDGLGMAETTPGPLIMVVQFVGFMGAWRNSGALDPMAAGVIGSVVTTWMTFAPCFLFIFVGAPFIEFLRHNRALGAALRGITAAVVGVVLNLAVWFAQHTLVVGGSADWTAIAIAAAALAAMFLFRAGMLPTLGGAAILGALAKMA